MAVVSADIGSGVSTTFDELKKSAANFFGNRGDLAGWEFIGASVEARTWWDRIWAPRTNPRRDRQASGGLQAELFDLAKQAGRSGRPLQALLHDMITNRGNFTALGRRLIPVLRNIANEHGNTTLEKRANQWQAELDDYERWMNDLIDRQPPAKPKKSPSKGSAPIVGVPQDKKSLLPGQNVAAEKMVNNVLRALPSAIAGDIRQAIARSPNKIQALQSELQKRGIPT